MVIIKKIPVLFNICFEDGNYYLLKTINKDLLDLFYDETTRVTRKYDGTAMLYDKNGNWFYRKTLKKGQAEPKGFILLTFDENTGKSFGWMPMDNNFGYKKAFEEALVNFVPEKDKSYELVGPKINNNHENLDSHKLILHGLDLEEDFPSLEEMQKHTEDFADFIRPYFKNLEEKHIEGIVFWKNGKPYAKLRTKDFYHFKNDEVNK